MAKNDENLVEVRTKAAITRAWTDLEPKFVAWLGTGGLLSAITVVLHYFGVLNVPFWVPIAATYLGGAVVAYLKHTTVKIPSTADAASAAVTAGITVPSEVEAVTAVPVTPAEGEDTDGENVYSTDTPDDAVAPADGEVTDGENVYVAEPTETAAEATPSA